MLAKATSSLSKLQCKRLVFHRTKNQLVVDSKVFNSAFHTIITMCL